MQDTSNVETTAENPSKAVKVVQFRYVASRELSSLFDDFRLMCNDAIRIALAQRPSSPFALIRLAYPRLKEYGLHTHYILSACEVAFSLYRNNNRKSGPRVEHAFLKLDNQSYRLNHLVLRIPTKARRFIFLTLRTSDYHSSFLDDPNLARGEITVTHQAVGIAFSKETSASEPRGIIGVDVNERNVTTSDTLGETNVHDISEIPEIKERYRETRARIGRQTRQDNRVSRELYAKYGRRERSRTAQPLHRISKAIVQRAKRNGLGISMEELRGIRKLYRKGNGQSAFFRGRMNTWTFRELQRQIEYKAAWLGVPVTYVNPRGTSRNCPDCGSRVAPLPKRQLYCAKCDKTWDRDVLASKNIMARVVPQARPPR